MFDKKEKIFLGVMILICVLLGVQIYMSYKIQKEIYDLDTTGWQPDIFNSNKKIIEKIDEVNSNLNDIYFKLD